MKKLSDEIRPTYSETHDIPPGYCGCGPVAIVVLVGAILKRKFKFRK